MGWYFDRVLSYLSSCDIKNRPEDGVVEIAFGEYIKGLHNDCDWLELGTSEGLLAEGDCA
jgi:hypothetical protein